MTKTMQFLLKSTAAIRRQAQEAAEDQAYTESARDDFDILARGLEIVEKKFAKEPELEGAPY